jgi:hypothetical protein
MAQVLTAVCGAVAVVAVDMVFGSFRLVWIRCVTTIFVTTNSAEKN